MQLILKLVNEYGFKKLFLAFKSLKISIFKISFSKKINLKYYLEIKLKDYYVNLIF